MGLGIGAIQQAKNTAALIADALRSAILQGKLRSGQALRQDEIAAEFNVSKIPVREALVQLQAEGLVDLIPGRGALVSHLSIDEIAEIYTIRRALEPLALERAIPNATRADFLKAEHILDEIDHVEDLMLWAELNWEFHAALYRPADMPLLEQTVQTLHNNAVRYLILNYLDRAYLEVSQNQHRELLALCRQQEIALACEKLRLHLLDPMEEIRRYE
jgi:DNA-binding GntR family transcriptional regulator